METTLTKKQYLIDDILKEVTRLSTLLDLLRREKTITLEWVHGDKRLFFLNEDDSKSKKDLESAILNIAKTVFCFLRGLDNTTFKLKEEDMTALRLLFIKYEFSTLKAVDEIQEDGKHKIVISTNFGNMVLMNK